MKNIKDLQVTVTYEVGIRDIEIPNAVLGQLKAMNESDTTVGFGEMTNSDALDWLMANIIEKDSCEIEYSIDELKE